MPTNIAQVISQGTNQTAQDQAQLRGTLDRGTEQKRMGLSDTMAVQEHDRKRQESIDVRADSWMHTGAYLDTQVDKARGAVDQILAKGGGAGEERNYDEAELAKATNLYDAAILKRNDFLKGSMANAKMMGLLKASSYADKTLGEKFFNPEVWNTLNPKEQEDIRNQSFAYHQAQQEMLGERGVDVAGLQAEAYAKRSGALIAEGEFSSPTLDTPDKSGLAEMQYESAAIQHEVEGKIARPWYLEDVAPLYPRVQALKDMDVSERTAIANLFKGWDGSKLKGQRINEQADDLATYRNFVNDYDMPELGIAGQKVVDRLQNILNDEDPDPRRLGIFINMMNAYIQPQRKSLQPTAH